MGGTRPFDAHPVGETLRIELEQEQVVSAPVEIVGDPRDLMGERQVDEADIVQAPADRRDPVAALGQSLLPVVRERDVKEPLHAAMMSAGLVRDQRRDAGGRRWAAAHFTHSVPSGSARMRPGAMRSPQTSHTP